MNILELNINKIIDIFETLPTTVVTPPQIAEILRDMKEARELPKSTTLHDFLDFILEATKSRLWPWNFLIAALPGILGETYPFIP